MAKGTFGDILSRQAFRGISSAVSKAGSATAQAEEKARKGQGLDPLVDPKGYGLIRRSISRMEKKDRVWELTNGVPMLVEMRLDTTGSMADNVDRAFKVLPSVYSLLGDGPKSALGWRYDLQMITSSFGDLMDVSRGVPYFYCRSQAEMDHKIAEQMTMLVPTRGGCGNMHESPEYGLFAAAFLTAADINRYELRSYDFTLSDEAPGDRLDPNTLEQVFGAEVYDKVAENGHAIDRNNLPSTMEIVAQLLQRAHAFHFHVSHDDYQVGNRRSYDWTSKNAWGPMYGEERFVILPSMEMSPYVMAAVVALTEGVVDLQSLPDFLMSQGARESGNGITSTEATAVRRAVAHIPIGAQASLPNFNRLPKAGDLFSKKGDLWPVDLADGKVGKVTKPARAEEDTWKL